MEMHPYSVFMIVFGVIFFGTALYGLYWAINTGQFEKLELGSRDVFTEDEPEGHQTDFFPGEANKSVEKIRAIEATKNNFKEV